MASVPSLTSLLKRSDIEDHEEVLRAAESQLKKSKSDLEAQNVRVVALLNLDRFEDAVRAFETGGEELKEKARLDYAYALYKSGKPAEAAQIARQGSSRGLMHVEAQARYRNEDFKRAAELYQQLAAELEDDAEADVRVNSSAVDAQLEWAGLGHLAQKKKPAREDLEAFETAYNAACGSIARGELGQSEILLKRARDLCLAVEDMSDEDKQAEILPITVQQMYVLVRLGKLQEAEKLASEVDVKSIPDASTRHIAHVNSVTASTTPQNPYLVQRQLAIKPDSLKPDYPFQFQASIMRQDKFALDLQSMKYGGTASSTAETISEQPAPTADGYITNLSVTNAAANARNQTGKESLKHILPLLEKRPNDVGLILTIVQLYVLTGNSASAITLLESFLARLEQSKNTAGLDVRFAPGLVGAMASLYTSQGRREHSRSELSKAATHWRRKSKDAPSGVTSLLKAAGAALTESREPEQQQLAKDIFQELHDRDPQDRYAAAGLLAASPETADSTSSLTPIDRLVAAIDASALENAGVAQALSSTSATTTRKRPAEETKPKKAKKLRKSKMPKDYDPSKTPDPERWLPLRDRSSYRVKGKKGKARQNLLSQGAVASESEGSRPATPGGEVVKGKGQQTGGAKKKKPGKGNKW